MAESFGFGFLFFGLFRQFFDSSKMQEYRSTQLHYIFQELPMGSIYKRKEYQYNATVRRSGYPEQRKTFETKRGHCLNGKIQTRLTTESEAVKNNFTATLIHSCCSKQLQPALGQYSISRVGQYSISADNCCHMVTFIYEHEAEVMALASGKEMRRIQFRTRKKVWVESARYVGRPCPFLAMGRCSIYASRPLICRLHHSLNEDPSECEKLTRPGARQGVYMYDPDYVEVPYHGLNDRYQPKEPWGAIQDFFPPE